MKAVRSFAYLLLSVVLLITSVTFSAEAQTDTYETMANLVVFVKFPEDNGTDIAAETGTEVYAVSPGEVTAVNDDPLWGTTVVIDHHNGYITKYCGLGKDLSVQKGDVLASGNVIGVTGDTADIESSLSPHLHIEIMHNGSYIDPMVVFG